MQHQTVPQTTSTDDEVKAWYFTFGAGQRFDGRYVKFTGTYDTARAAMLARFGNAWCAQYDSLSPTRGFPLGVDELPASEWPQPAEPDYWLTLADDLRQAADRIATLAGTLTPPVFSPYFSIYTNYTLGDADRSVPVVDALAAAFDSTAETKTEGRGQNRTTKREMKANCGKVRVAASAHMPNLPTRQEKLRSRAELENRVAELEAKLAEGGADR